MRFRAACCVSIILSAAVSGCSTFQPVSMDQLAGRPTMPEELLVSTARDKQIKVRYPRLAGDSLLGLAADRDVRLHRQEVTSVKAKKFSADATGLFAMGAIAIGVPVVWLFLIATSGGI
jgi:hypothetical protein